MFKWTDQNNIKCIILDYDSLDYEYITHDYCRIIEKVKILTISKTNRKYFTYITLSQVINHIINVLKIPSDSIVIISNDYTILKESLKKHIGTIATKHAIDDNIYYQPDFTLNNVETIDSLLSTDYVGFTAEAIAEENIENKKKPFQ